MLSELCLIITISQITTVLCTNKVSILNSDPTKIRGFSITDFISNHGYPVEVHKNLQTPDGYLLDIHRIPNGKNSNGQQKRPAILLMHGFLGSSENWIVSGPAKGLGFILADQGYDVWMGNARGNLHSRKHVSLNPDTNRAFWQFSWNEIGIYDLPVLINYIRKATNHEQLSYVGHSQGTTVYFVMGSERPEYLKYVKVMIALAPVVYMTPASFSIGGGLSQSLLMSYVNQIPVREIQSNSNNCVNIPQFTNYCFNPLSGLNTNGLSPSEIQLFKKLFPAGGSSRQGIHYMQEYFSGKFAHYDYGIQGNIAKYKTSVPAAYNLKRINSPVALFYANQDNLAPPANVERLAKNLPKVVLKYLVPSRTFNHLDFLTSKDVFKLVYSKVLEVLKKYN